MTAPDTDLVLALWLLCSTPIIVALFGDLQDAFWRWRSRRRMGGTRA